MLNSSVSSLVPCLPGFIMDKNWEELGTRLIATW